MLLQLKKRTIFRPVIYRILMTVLKLENRKEVGKKRDNSSRRYYCASTPASRFNSSCDMSYISSSQEYRASPERKIVIRIN